MNFGTVSTLFMNYHIMCFVSVGVVPFRVFTITFHLISVCGRAQCLTLFNVLLITNLFDVILFQEAWQHESLASPKPEHITFITQS